MRLNLVQFADLHKIDALSERLGDDSVIIAGDLPTGEIKKPTAQNAGPKTKFYFCSLLPRNDNALLQKVRKPAALTAIRGNSLEGCSFAANQKLDLLLNPFTSEKNFLDVQSANVLAGNGTFIGILFRDFLGAEGFARSQLLKNAAMSLKVAQRAGTKLLFFSGAHDEAQMRAAKDLSSFGVMLGMKREDALRAIKENASEFAERVK